ncbi:hypothetical protein ACQKN7_11050 [Bacillus cereus]|uniref:hypothetical protein n=1 Tax=Bacillus cereus TaxID=1396 RepID=UPI0011454C75|nr:hypothetical protein [Bacillus cereus]MDR2993428.1 hypothetical protein [Bacillus cereus]
MKKKIILFTTLLVVGGSAGIYTAFAAESEQSKQSQTRQSEVKKVKEIEEKKSMEKAVEKLGVSTDGKTKEVVAKEVNAARFEKRHDLLIEHAKQLGIDTEGKKDEEIILEIGKIQHGK